MNFFFLNNNICYITYIFPWGHRENKTGGVFICCQVFSLEDVFSKC